MSYDVAEAGFITTLRILANYTKGNSSQGDYRILGKGVKRAVIVNPGAIRGREVTAAPRRVRTLWTINIELYVPFKGEISTTAKAIRVDRQEIIDHIDKYPTLDSTANVINAFITSGREPEIWKGGSRNWWRQVMTCEVEERVNVVSAE